MCVKLCVGVGVNHFKGRRWSPSGHRCGDWSIWSGMTAQSGHVTSVRSNHRQPHTHTHTTTPGVRDRQPPHPQPPAPHKKNTHMFTSQPLFCGLTSERVLLSTTRRMIPIDVYLVFKALISARLHSLSSLRISGPHWEVSLMTHKHISMTFMWNRAYQVCVCARETDSEI